MSTYAARQSWSINRKAREAAGYIDQPLASFASDKVVQPVRRRAPSTASTTVETLAA
jgi:hypothetical protein